MQEKYVRLRSYPGGHLTYRVRGVVFQVGVWVRVPVDIISRGASFPLADFLASRRYPDGRATFDVVDRDGALAVEERERKAAEQIKRETAMAAITGSAVERAPLLGAVAGAAVPLAPVALASPPLLPEPKAPALPARDDGAEHFSKEDLAEEREEAAEVEAAAAKVAGRKAGQATNPKADGESPSASHPTTSRRAARLARGRKGDKPPT